jgi:hypothetical protein
LISVMILVLVLGLGLLAAILESIRDGMYVNTENPALWLTDDDRLRILYASQKFKDANKEYARSASQSVSSMDYLHILTEQGMAFDDVFDKYHDPAQLAAYRKPRYSRGFVIIGLILWLVAEINGGLIFSSLANL